MDNDIDKEKDECGAPPSQAGEMSIQETPEEELTRLKAELQDRKREAEENYGRFLRACADLENYKKRVEKEKSELVNFGNETLLETMLPVIDNLERALEHANGESPNTESLKQGIRLTIEQFGSVLKKFGLEPVKAVGQRFDPALHHAISHEESDTVPAGTVLKEFQKGYMLKGRLLRPSMVSVAKPPLDKPAERPANAH
jgi:molecular chaperone GrpE